MLSLNFPPIPPPSSVSWPHTNYQHTLFHLIIIQTKRPVLKETSGGEEKTRGWEVTEPPCVITNKDLIKLNSMPRKTAKGSQLLIKANKCLFKMNAHECRQNWTSIIINLHRRCKDHSKGNGQQFFWSMCPTFCPCNLIKICPNLGKKYCPLVPYPCSAWRKLS